MWKTKAPFIDCIFCNFGEIHYLMPLTEAQIIQQKLLEQAKTQLETDLKLVDVLAELFDTSSDSAYRRIRLDKLMTLDEIIKLCVHFDLSFDEFLDGSPTRVAFHFQPIDETNFTFVDYLEYVERMMRKVANSVQNEMLYLANDIPIFHLMNAPELASFKLFFWQKTILNFESLREEKFELNVKDERVNAASRKMREHYYKVDSTEIFCGETIDITLKQINYYFEANLFKDDKIALLLLDRLEMITEHLRKQCEAGLKYRMEQELPEINELSATYTAYYNEVLYTDTTILAKLDDERWSYANNNGLNVMSTKDPNYYNQQLAAIDMLKKRSTLISGDSEKERNRVFNAYTKKITQLKQRITVLLDEV